MSVEAAKWQWALRTLGFSTTTIAGQPPADHVLSGLAIEAIEPIDEDALASAVANVDLLVIDNVLSLPLNPEASAAVSAVAAGRRAIVRHHDLPWQRPRFAAWSGRITNDPSWLHVTINDLSRHELHQRGVTATTMRNRFDTDPPDRDRDGVRAALGLSTSRLALQPTRALERKGIPEALSLAAQMGATYWLLGPAEDGYDDELARLLSEATVPVIRGLDDLSVEDAYAGCDIVLFPSTWEGFGNPAIESAVHRRPLVIGHYPVAKELAAFGFRWFSPADIAEVAAFLDAPDEGLLDHNQDLARRHFALTDLPRELQALFDGAGWAW